MVLACLPFLVGGWCVHGWDCGMGVKATNCFWVVSSPLFGYLWRLGGGSVVADPRGGAWFYYRLLLLRFPIAYLFFGHETNNPIIHDVGPVVSCALRGINTKSSCKQPTRHKQPLRSGQILGTIKSYELQNQRVYRQGHPELCRKDCGLV